MTTANLLARLRTLLNEAPASFWTDTEAYAALADGQRELVGLFVNRYKTQGGALPNVLRTCVLIKTTAPLTSTSEALPAGFLHPLSVRYDHDGTAAAGRIPALIRDIDNLYQKQGNTYLVGSSANPVVWFDQANINFETAYATAGSYDMQYIGMPTDIASGTNPTLPDNCMEAIAVFAFGFLLAKDDRTQESEQQMQKFYQLAQGLYE